MRMVAELSDQFERQFKTLDGVYERAGKDAWACRDDRVKGVWQWLLHTLETVEFYLSEKPPDQFPWRHRFGLDWENGAAERVPGKDEMRAYQADVAQLVRQILGAKTDRDLLIPEAVAPYTGTLYMGKLLYLMRHTQQHIGDINRVLRLNGDEPLEWH